MVPNSKLKCYDYKSYISLLHLIWPNCRSIAMSVIIYSILPCKKLCFPFV